MKRRDFLRLSVLLLASCAVPGESLPSAAPTVRTATPASGTAACRPEPMVVPTRPAKIPTVYELDDVGLHVTAQPVDIDPATYHLQVSGLVDRPLLLSLDELRCLPQTTMKTTLTCPGYFSDRSTWGGTPLKPILDSAGVQPAAEKLYLIGADSYQGIMTLAEGLNSDNFLAYQLENGPVPVLHGFPVRAVFPGRYGFSWTKWLVEIKVV